MSDFLKASHASRISLIGLCCLACAIPLFATRGQPASRPGKIASISDLQCNDMKLHHVLNLDAPVGCDRLSLVSFDYVGYDGQIHHDGEIVVMDVAADYVLQIFATLRQHSFPIAKSRPMDSYDGDDNASMADNNTSAFNDRQIAGGGTLSLHAYGLAIDLNPLQNPYARRAGAVLVFSPKAGISYANRLEERPGRKPRPGMAEAAIDVFADNGFLIWGGYWDNPIDYQHFQVPRDLAEQLVKLSPADGREAFSRFVERYRSCRQAGSPMESDRVHCVAAEEAAGAGEE